jgi:hypothetical protein
VKFSFNIETLSNPKFVIDAKQVVIRNKPSKIYLILFGFHILFFTILSYQPDRSGKVPISILIAILLFYWFYKSITVNTTIFCIEDKMIRMKTSNPIKYLIQKMLGHPSIISYKKVSKVYIEVRPLIRNSFFTNSVILETEDPYKFEIGTFDDKDLAQLFLNDLKSEIKKKKDTV